MQRTIIAALLLYFVVANLTGAHYSNHRCDTTLSSPSCGFEAVYVGGFWPLYWSSRVAIEVTK